MRASRSIGTTSSRESTRLKRRWRSDSSSERLESNTGRCLRDLTSRRLSIRLKTTNLSTTRMKTTTRIRPNKMRVKSQKTRRWVVSLYQVEKPSSMSMEKTSTSSNITRGRQETSTKHSKGLSTARSRRWPVASRRLIR